MPRLLASLLLAASMIGMHSSARAGEETPPASSAPLDPAKDAPGLEIGAKAPDAKLKDSEGADVQLAEMYAKGPVVVTFYRGGWCPHCNKALRALDDMREQFEAAGATIVAISPEMADHTAETARKNETEFMVLVDAEKQAMRAFRVAFMLDEATREKYRGYGIDLAERNADGSWELPAPATFVIDRAGVVRWIHADWDYRKRADPAQVLEAVRKL